MAAFWGIMLGGVALFALLTFIVIRQSLDTPRREAQPILESYGVQEWATLPDEDAYPAAVAAAPDGTVYTGSYVTGALWAIEDGTPSEIPETRQAIGSVTGLDVDLDGALYILDRVEQLSAAGAVIWRWSADEGLQDIIRLPNEIVTGVYLPDDIALDSQGYIYITDRGSDNADKPRPHQILRFDPDGSNRTVWWESPRLTNDEALRYAPTGLAYDIRQDALLITDGERNSVYRVPVRAEKPNDATEVLYEHTRQDTFPGLDGITVTSQGEIYVAALAMQSVARLDVADDGAANLVHVVGNFRGSSDVAYDPVREHLVVTNWDQRSLLPEQVFLIQVDLEPHLPFALDVIDLPEAG